MAYTVTILCVAEVLTMTGVSTYAALLPVLRAEWGTSNTVAGSISGAFFAGYLAGVPMLVSLTDRVPARRVYVAACAALAAGAAAFARATGPVEAMAAHALLGAGLAGTYMPGLKELSDRTAGPRQSRAIAIYTSSFGVGGSLSFWMAGAVQPDHGWRTAFAAAAIGPIVAAALIVAALPAMPSTPRAHPSRGLFRLVLRDRRIAGYVMGYAAHCWELFAVRSWLVAFLSFAAPGTALTAPTIAAIVNLLGPLASISGNEIAAGRRVRMVRITMTVSAALAVGTGIVVGMGAAAVIFVTSLYVLAIMADSAAMTAGLVEVSPPDARGTAMAVYSFFGFAGALLGPITFGALLDAGGGASSDRAWLVAFGGLAAVSLAGVAALTSRAARPSDRPASPGAPAGNTPGAPPPPGRTEP